MSKRRAFLKFVAASPLLAGVSSIAEAFQQDGLDQAADTFLRTSGWQVRNQVAA